MNKPFVFISLLSMSFFPAFLMAKTYCWEDAQGSTVCSDRLPKDAREVKVIPPPPPPAESPEEARRKLDLQIQQLNEVNEERLADKNEAAKKKAESKHRQTQCANARMNLTTISSRPPRTLYQTGDGKYKRFTAEERAEEIKLANEAIKKYCR